MYFRLMFPPFVIFMHKETFSDIFFHAGIYSSYFMRGTMKSLADMQNLPDESFPFRKQVFFFFFLIFVLSSIKNNFGSVSHLFFWFFNFAIVGNTKTLSKCSCMSALDQLFVQWDLKLS